MKSDGQHTVDLHIQLALVSQYQLVLLAQRL